MKKSKPADKKITAAAPQRLCLVRLSSIGDVVHVLPIINTLRSRWPQTHITWVINQTEYDLVKAVPGIHFAVFKKNAGMRAYWQIKKRLSDQRFDVLLLMQNSLRANLLPLFIKARWRVGFDRRRSKEGHSLFINHRVQAAERQHVLDGFFCFTESLGLTEKKLVWDRCYNERDQACIEQRLANGTKKILLISPCSSSERRNWLVHRYAKAADYAIEKHAMQVVLSGANRAVDHRYGQQIERGCRHPINNLIGQTTLPQLMALMARADLAIAPDSGPLHMANAVNTPVIGLFAASNPLRTGAYLYPQWCINRYPQAVQKFLHRDWQAVPWGTRVHNKQAMSLITDDEVIAMIDRVASSLI